MDSEPEACRAVVALSEAQVAVANAGCRAVDPAFPRITGLGPGAADSDPRAAPAIQDGLGQVNSSLGKAWSAQVHILQRAVGGSSWSLGLWTGFQGTQAVGLCEAVQGMRGGAQESRSSIGGPSGEPGAFRGRDSSSRYLGSLFHRALNIASALDKQRVGKCVEQAGRRLLLRPTQHLPGSLTHTCSLEAIQALSPWPHPEGRVW